MFSVFATSGSAQTSVRGVTNSEIVVAGIAEAQSYSGIEVGAKARYERANREGGINGRKIRFIGVKDDGSDNSRNLDTLRGLVENDNVFAVAPVATQSFLPASSDYLQTNKVPFVGWGFMPGFCGNSYGFGFNGCLVGSKYVNGSYLSPIAKALKKPIKGLKFAFQSEDGAAGRQANADYELSCKKLGCKTVYSKANIPLDTKTTDYSPYVQAILATKPDVVYVNVSFTNVIGLSAALKSAGFTGAMVNFVAYVPGLLQAQPGVAQALDGSYINSQIPPAESNAPATNQIKKDLKAIGQQPVVGFGTSVGYWSADVLVQELAAAGKNLTPDTFDQKVNGGFTSKTLKGGIGAVNYPADHEAPVPCDAIVRIAGTKYKVSAPMSCYTNIKK